MQNTDGADLAARMKHRHEADEAERVEKERAGRAQAELEARAANKERELVAVIDDVVAQLNAQLPQPWITAAKTPRGQEYRFSDRVLKVCFFRPGELYSNSLVPGRMDSLHRQHAIHAGYVEITERGEDREGWNVVLVGPPDCEDSEWRIVETRVSALTGRMARYEPFATQAQLFADNLACHWSRVMHTFNLTDKSLERTDVLRILNTFVPK